MKIEIITTGDEVMQGVIVDTNTPWIAERCHMFGHEVVRHQAVADDAAAIGEALVAASKNADAVVVTGGLGPTADDITVEAAAGAFGAKLVMHEEVLEEIRRFFERVGRPMSRSNEKQALVPEGAEVLPNRVGTAPGIKVKFGGAWFFFLPGVPRELYQIFDDSVAPWLKEGAAQAISERVLRCFGLPEASVDEKLSGVDLSGARLSFRVKFPEVILKVVARDADPAKARQSTTLAAGAIREKLGVAIYGEGETSLAEALGAMLVERKMTLAVAESCTGGELASRITDVAGASAWFDRGAVTYSNRSKMEMLSVPEDVLRAHGAVSEETAIAMAEGLKKSSGASIAVAITGIAGPGGGSPEKPVGTVFAALAAEGGVRAHERHISRDRVGFKQFVAWTALDLVRRHLLGA
ncbi:MAG TPA: competence/damage-inducible protein A [bacterium]|nr:competence/damage-inducible protein A [bacterium]